MPYGEIARGLSDVKVYPLTGADVAGAAVDVPGARTLSFQPEQDSEDWEGDDTVIATAQDNKTGSGSLAVGRQNPTALAAMLGGTAVVSGTTPAQITTYDESAAANEKYVMIKGQSKSLDQGGSAYRVTLHKAKLSSPSESLALKSFNEPSMDLTFLPNATGLFIRREWYETAVALPATGA